MGQWGHGRCLMLSLIFKGFFSIFEGAPPPYNSPLPTYRHNNWFGYLDYPVLSSLKCVAQWVGLLFL